MQIDDPIVAETVRQWRRGWWGGHWQPPEPLSIVQLMQAGSLDARLLGLAWLLLEAHASVLVAAEPPEAGKTTTLTALLEFLPREVTRVYTRGFDETFAFVRQTEPANTWILCNEISPDLPVYTWGPAVPALFAALEAGYAVATTMHADTLDAIVDVLTGYPLGVPRRQIGLLSLVLNLRIRYAEGDRGPLGRSPGGGFPTKEESPWEVVRRVGSAHLLEPSLAGDDSFRRVEIARYDEAQDRLAHDTTAAVAFLARRTGRTPRRVEEEWGRRAAFLDGLALQGIAEVGRVREALALYRDGTLL